MDNESIVNEANVQKEIPPKKKNNLKQKCGNWIWLGIFISVFCALVYAFCYKIYSNTASSDFSSIEGTVETADNLDWLYSSNQVLYKSLYNRINHMDLEYLDLYYPQIFDLIMDESGEGFGDDLISYINSYFNQLENNFTRLGSNYDYMIRDTKTGEVISNTGETETLSTDKYTFYISFIYDEEGNISIGNLAWDPDVESLRKTLNEIIRSQKIASDINLQNMYGDYLKTYLTNNRDYLNSDQLYADQYITAKSPVNCEIIYGIKKSEWSRFIDNNTHYTNNYAYINNSSTLSYFLILLVILCFVGAIFIPRIDKSNPWQKLKVLRIPLEGVILLIFIIMGFMSEMLWRSINVAFGIEFKTMMQATKNSVLSFYLVYGRYLLLLTCMFFMAWYCGFCIRPVRQMGVRNYIKERSWIYRFFPYMKKKSMETYDWFMHLDITKDAKKQILKIVLINAAILFIISSLWFGGLPITIVYSVVLYFVLKKYISDLQKKYGILLRAMNEIAEGDLNVSIIEDLGVFETLKPQIIKIQRGFRNAVEEEVKSQRMKTELITNVSHDLKTPLTAIITYIGLLQEENVTEEQRKEYLKTLETKSIRLKILIEDLFEVSKATSKNVTLNIMDVDINSLVKQVELETSHKLQESNLNVRMNLLDSKILIPLDSQKTYRIYENLFVNVAKYALPNTRVYVGSEIQDNHIVITIKNITAQEINVSAEELLDRFVRGDSARNSEGSGLGLAIAQSLVELQNGKISIEIDGDLFKVTTKWKIPHKEAQETE